MGLFGRKEIGVGEVIGSSVREAFQAISVRFKEYPDGQMYPGEWLARGVKKDNPEQRLIPQAGKFASFGIFFSDNFDNLVIPESGILYVCSSRKFYWLSNESADWQNMVEQVATRKHLDTRSISGGYEAERVLYENNCVFQSNSGIATLNHPITLGEIDFVLKCGNKSISLLHT